MDVARHHQLHGVQPVLPVHDVRAAVDWYERVLGFKADVLWGEPLTHARVKAGDGSWGQPVYIHLGHVDTTIVPSGATRLHVGHDIDGLHASVLAAGATVLVPPEDQPWGLREMTLQAPGGHRLVLGAEIAHHEPHDLPRPVIACYRPRPGHEAALRELVFAHVPLLQRLGLATDRAPWPMQAADGTVVEVFEWASAAAIASAHRHPEVLAMWAAFDAACTHAKLADLAEAGRLFPDFTPLEAG